VVTDGAARERAIEQFCVDVHPRLVGTLVLHSGDVGLAEELAQEALARAWERWDDVSRADRPDAWVYRVAFNLMNSRFRRRSAERRAYERAATNPMEVAIDVDRAEILSLRAAVAALPPKQRQAVLLRYYADLKIDDVADVMGCARGTVKSLTAAAIANLRRSVGGFEEVDVDA
jgi:RNA polymerase sigma-70 factor (ECF subfamily)